MADVVERAPDVREVISRTEKGRFEKGKSGNALGRPKGSKNKITLIKQSLELQLREQAAPDIGEVLAKAFELALEGDAQMIKMLVELHMSKGTNEDGKASEKVAIQINSAPREQVKVIAVAPEIKEESPPNDT